MQDYTKLLQRAVLTARNEAGYKQAYVAELAGIDVRTVTNIEKGRGNPKLQILYAIISVLGIDAREVFNPEMTYEDSRINQFRLLLESCTETEAEAALNVAKTVVNEIHSAKNKPP